MALLALALAAAAAAADVSTATAVLRSTAAWAETDRLYFTRDQPGRLESAEALLRERLRAGEDAATLWRLGRCLVRLGERETKKARKLERFREAERLAGRAVELDPKDPEAHFILGLAYGRRGQTQGMMRSLFLVGPIRKEMEAALALDPRHGGAHHVLGEMLRQLPRLAGGSKSEGLAHLEKAVEVAPGRTAAYADLAQAYLDAGEREKARVALEKLLAVKAPDDPAELAGDLEDGRRLLETLGRSDRR